MKICPACQAGGDPALPACPGCAASLAGVPDRTGNDLVGLRLGEKYELSEFVGEGAMGWVYRGLHRALDSSIAVKLMKPTGEVDGTRDRRFEQEARAASHLNHPHIISVIDFGRTAGGFLYIVSEFLRGRTLSALLQEAGALPLGRAARILDQVLSAVEEAHSAGVIHRDLKPENIFITPLRSGEDFVKVLDFGIAKISGPADHKLTVQGQLFGTPAYMSPEQIRGKEVSAASDLYACGLIFFEMLAGRGAFPCASVIDALSAQLHEPPPKLQDVVPELQAVTELDAVLHHLLQKDPDTRYQTAPELRAALRAALAGAPAGGQSARCGTCSGALSPGDRFCPQCGMRCGSDDAIPRIGADQRPAGMRSVSREVPVPRRASPSDQTLAIVSQSRAANVTGEARLPSHPTLERRLAAEKTLRIRVLAQDDLLAALATFACSDASVGLLSGAPGSGRTTLLTQLGVRTRAQGLRTLLAEADPLGLRRPWYPVQSLVAGLLGLPALPAWPTGTGLAFGAAELRAAAMDSGLGGEDLAGLEELFGLSSRPGSVETAVRKREVRSALQGVLLRSGPAAEGLLVLCDDAEEYDDATRGALRQLIAQGEGSRLKILVTDDSLLPDGRPVVEFEPHPLDARAVEELIRDLLPGPPTSWPDLPGLLAERSGGNPLHVIQALRLLVEGGSEIEAPVTDLILTRVGRLPTDALRILQVASCIGRRAPTDVVQELSGAPGSFAGSLRLLMRRGLVEPDTERVVCVSHPRIGECVRESIPADARRALHAEIHCRGLATGAPPCLIALHAEEARLGEPALTALLAAAERCESRLDDTGAADRYRRALHLARWTLLRDEADPLCLDITLRMGRTLRFSGDPQAAELVLKEALPVAERLPAWGARFHRALSWLHQTRGERSEAMGRMRSALRLVIIAGDRDGLCETYSDLGQLLVGFGAAEQAVDELQEGLLMVTSGDGARVAAAPAGFWRLLLQLAEAELALGDPERSLLTGTDALRHASGVPIGEARCRSHQARCHRALGQLGQAEEDATAAFESFRRLGDRLSAAECLLDHAAGQPERYRERLPLALAFARQLGWPEGIAAAEQLLSRAGTA